MLRSSAVVLLVVLFLAVSTDAGVDQLKLHVLTSRAPSNATADGNVVNVSLLQVSATVEPLSIASYSLQACILLTDAAIFILDAMATRQIKAEIKGLRDTFETLQHMLGSKMKEAVSLLDLYNLNSRILAQRLTDLRELEGCGNRMEVNYVSASCLMYLLLIGQLQSASETTSVAVQDVSDVETKMENLKQAYEEIKKAKKEATMRTYFDKMVVAAYDLVHKSAYPLLVQAVMSGLAMISKLAVSVVQLATTGLDVALGAVQLVKVIRDVFRGEQYRKLAVEDVDILNANMHEDFNYFECKLKLKMNTIAQDSFQLIEQILGRGRYAERIKDLDEYFKVYNTVGQFKHLFTDKTTDSDVCDGFGTPEKTDELFDVPMPDVATVQMMSDYGVTAKCTARRYEPVVDCLFKLTQSSPYYFHHYTPDRRKMKCSYAWGFVPADINRHPLSFPFSVPKTLRFIDQTPAAADLFCEIVSAFPVDALYESTVWNDFSMLRDTTRALENIAVHDAPVMPEGLEPPMTALANYAEKNNDGFLPPKRYYDSNVPGRVVEYITVITRPRPSSKDKIFESNSKALVLELTYRIISRRSLQLEYFQAADSAMRPVDDVGLPYRYVTGLMQRELTSFFDQRYMAMMTYDPYVFTPFGFSVPVRPVRENFEEESTTTTTTTKKKDSIAASLWRYIMLAGDSQDDKQPEDMAVLSESANFIPETARLTVSKFDKYRESRLRHENLKQLVTERIKAIKLEIAKMSPEFTFELNQDRKILEAEVGALDERLKSLSELKDVTVPDRGLFLLQLFNEGPPIMDVRLCSSERPPPHRYMRVPLWVRDSVWTSRVGNTFHRPLHLCYMRDKFLPPAPVWMIKEEAQEALNMAVQIAQIPIPTQYWVNPSVFWNNICREMVVYQTAIYVLHAVHLTRLLGSLMIRGRSLWKLESNYDGLNSRTKSGLMRLAVMIRVMARRVLYHLMRLPFLAQECLLSTHRNNLLDSDKFSDDLDSERTAFHLVFSQVMDGLNEDFPSLTGKHYYPDYVTLTREFNTPDPAAIDLMVAVALFGSSGDSSQKSDAERAMTSFFEELQSTTLKKVIPESKPSFQVVQKEAFEALHGYLNEFVLMNSFTPHRKDHSKYVEDLMQQFDDVVEGAFTIFYKERLTPILEDHKERSAIQPTSVTKLVEELIQHPRNTLPFDKFPDLALALLKYSLVEGPKDEYARIEKDSTVHRTLMHSLFTATNDCLGHAYLIRLIPSPLFDEAVGLPPCARSARSGGKTHLFK